MERKQRVRSVDNYYRPYQKKTEEIPTPHNHMSREVKPFSSGCIPCDQHHRSNKTVEYVNWMKERNLWGEPDDD